MSEAAPAVPGARGRTAGARFIGPIARRWPGAFERVGRFAKFGTVGLSGFVVNELALAGAVGVLGVNYLVGVAIATEVSTIWNFALVEVWAFRHHEPHHSLRRRLALFFVLNNLALLARIPIVAVLTAGLGVNYLLSNLVSLGLLTVLRFLVADSWIWAGSPKQVARAGSD